MRLAVLAAVFLAGLVLVLAAAPWWIAAPAVREVLVRLVERESGMRLRVEGPVSFSWWPTPQLSLARLRIDSTPGEAGMVALEADRLDAELHPLAWITGGTPLTQLRLVRPRLLSLAGSPAGLLAAAAAAPDGFRIAALEVLDGTIAPTGIGEVLRDLQARYRRGAEGGFQLNLEGRLADGTLVRLNGELGRFALGRPAPLALHLALLQDRRELAQLRFSGTLGSAGDPLALDGALTASFAAPEPPLEELVPDAARTLWRALQGLRLEAARARMAQGMVALEELSLEREGKTLRGRLELDLAAPRPVIALALEGSELPLDQAKLARLVRLRRTLPPFSGRIDLRLDRAMWGRLVLRELELLVRIDRKGNWRVERFAASLAGDSTLELEAVLSGEAGLEVLSGRAALLSGEAGELWAALSGQAPAALGRLAAEAAFRLDSRALQLSDLKLRHPAGTLSGRGRLRWDEPSWRLALRGERLRLEALDPGLWKRLQDWLAEPEPSIPPGVLTLDLESLLLRGMRLRGVELALAIAPETVVLERLRVGEAAGASGTVSGRFDLQSGALALEGALKVAESGRLIRLIGGRWSQLPLPASGLEARFALRGDRRTASARIGLSWPSGRAWITGRSQDPETLSRFAIDLELWSPDTARLLRDLGLPRLALGPELTGPLELAGRLVRGPRGLEVQGEGRIAGLGFAGDIRPAERDQGGMVARLAFDRLPGSALLDALAPLFAGPMGLLRSPPGRWIGAWPEEVLDWSWLSGPKLFVEIALGEGRLVARREKGRLSLEARRLPLLQGRIDGKMTLAGLGAGVRMEADAEFSGLRLVPADPMRVFGLPTGTLAGRLALASRGISLRDLARNLSGEVRFAIRAGELLGLAWDPDLGFQNRFREGLRFRLVEGDLAVERGMASTATPLRIAAERGPPLEARLRFDAVAWILDLVLESERHAVRLLGPPWGLVQLPAAPARGRDSVLWP